MGAITRFRQVSPYFLGFFAVLFVAFMVLQDAISPGSSQGGKSPDKVVVGTVNGEDITMKQYQDEVNRQRQLQEIQNPQAPVDLETVQQQVWESIVSDVLRKQQAKKLGVEVTKEELTDIFSRNPPPDLLQNFRDSAGNFMRDQYEMFMFRPDDYEQQLRKSGRISEAEIQKYMIRIHADRKNIEKYFLDSKLEEALRLAVGSSASMVSPSYAEWTYNMDNSTADISFVAIDANRVPDNQVTVSDADVQAYYDKTKDRYVQKPARQLKYFVIPLVASAKDTSKVIKASAAFQQKLGTATTIEERDAAFTQQLASSSGNTTEFMSVKDITDPSVSLVLKSMQEREVFGPLGSDNGIRYLRLDGRRDGVNPSVQASHILFKFDQGSKDSLKAEANRVLGLARKGEDFASLAMQYSKDQGSAQRGGDLGYFGKGMMVKQFDSVCFDPSIAIGQIVGPVETQYGYHIIKIVDRVNTELKYSEIVFKPVLSPTTRNQIMYQAQQAENDITAGKSIDDVAKALKFAVIETKPFQRTTPLFGSAEMTAWAFNAEKGAVIRKDMKSLGGMLVAQVSDIREAGTQPLADVKDMIRQKLMVAKKLEKLKSLASQVASTAQSSGIASVASIDSTLRVVPMQGVKNNGSLSGFGGEYQATNEAFKLGIGSTSGAIQGQRAWFVIQVNNRTMADKSVYAREKVAVMQNQATRTRGTAYYTWFQTVRDNAEIVDKRSNPDN